MKIIKDGDRDRIVQELIVQISRNRRVGRGFIVKVTFLALHINPKLLLLLYHHHHHIDGSLLILCNSRTSGAVRRETKPDLRRSKTGSTGHFQTGRVEL